MQPFCYTLYPICSLGFWTGLEILQVGCPGLLPTDDDDDDEPGPSSKHTCFMVPPTNCWNEEDLIDIYGPKVDINTAIVDAAGLTDNLSLRMDYDKYVSSSLSSHTAADYLLSDAAKAQYPLDIRLSSVVHMHVTTLLLYKHKLSFVNCKWCKGKAHDHENDLPVWMIDSGASLHFTYDISDLQNINWWWLQSQSGLQITLPDSGLPDWNR